jgi:hypothetical protein
VAQLIAAAQTGGFGAYPATSAPGAGVMKLFDGRMFLPVVVLFLTGLGHATCPLGDLNADCEVDFADLQLLAEQWLITPAGTADLNYNEQVGLDDLAILAGNWRRKGVPLAINEVMASNSKTIADPQGEFDDWIEIYNAGSEAINTGRMYLTDDLTEPTKWQIPTSNSSLTTIASKGYLLIWTDNDVGDSGLHANFKLDAGSDTVALFDKDGNSLIDSIEFGNQTTNISYGRDPNYTNTWRFFATPTPGAVNRGAYLGVIADTKFSHDRGFYEEPFTVTITTETPGATIYYTVDGSAPFDMTRGVPMGLIYSTPVSITTTTPLRAMAFKVGWKPTNIDTQTYIFLDDVIRQATDPVTGAQVIPPGYPNTWPGGSYSGAVTGDYQMDPDVIGQNGKDKFGGLYAKTIKDDLKSAPTISLVMERDNWFGSTGIYINQSLDGTERACSLEWIDPNGEGGFQINCAISMQGGVSGGGTSLDRWKVFKCSMRPRFKTALDNGEPTGGPTQLDYRVFPDSLVSSYDTIVLDGLLANTWNHRDQHNTPNYLQDQFTSDLHNAMGGQSPHGLFAHLYINGLYWGMYNVHERPDHAWAAQMFGGEKEEYDAIKHNASMVVNNSIGGSATANFNAMISPANAVAADPTNAAKYEALCQKLDIDNFITDLLAHWFAVNWDWPDKNWYATHRSPDGPWRFHVWDAEHSLEYWSSQNVLGQSVAGIHDKLKTNAEYRIRFADLAHRYFFNGGVLSYPYVADMYRARIAQIDRVIIGESARWGDTRSSIPHTRADWVVIENNILSQFIQPRSTFVLNWLKNAGLYPSVDAPVFYINNSYQYGGHAATGSQLSMTKSIGVIWYTLDGSDPRVPGSGGTIMTSTLVPENAAKKVLVPTVVVNDAWKGGSAFDDSSWTAGTGGVGYETSSGYEAYFSIDVRQQMHGKNTTCYIRIPFALSSTQLADIQSLTLKVRYDDGFVAYINGTEVKRALFTGTPTWNSQADSTHDDSVAVVFESFDISGYISALHQGANILAIHGLDGASSSDFLISVELVAGKGTTGATPSIISPTAIEYTGPISLTRSVHVKSRVLNGNTWSALNEAVFAVGPIKENLRITEIMYHPLETTDSSEPNTEYVELKNTCLPAGTVGSQTINLNLVQFTKGIDFTFGDTALAPNGYILVVRDPNAFTAKYGQGLPVAGTYSGSLDNAGEKIELTDAAGTVIHSFKYEDNWYDITDGTGFSLTVKDPANIPAEPNSLSDKSLWRPSANIGGSPGYDDTGVLPELGDIVINEIMAHSHAAGDDWIELHNTTNKTISIAGWLLSDDENNLSKYRIAQGTVIGPYGYKVFYEHEHFNNLSDAGCMVPFALSENGETLYLQSASGGILTGYSESEKFDASKTGVSMGRYLKSTGTYNFVFLETPTPGSANSYPLVGPVVINEIMYHPDGVDDAEYVELLNISSGPVTLYDSNENVMEAWRFTDDPDNPGIDFRFPTDSPVTLNAGEYLLLVKDSTLFSSKYTAPAGVQIFSWGSGQLDNAGEKVQLSKPGDLDSQGTRYWIRVDRVVYSDGGHSGGESGAIDPWPADADGLGKSLSRINADRYGNDPNNWQAANPTPGGAN